MTDGTPLSTTQMLIDRLPAILTALGVLFGVWVSWMNGRKSDAIKKQQDTMATAVDGVAAHVDGAATKSVEKIQALLNERDQMRADKAEAKQVAAVLAATTATQPAKDPP